MRLLNTSTLQLEQFSGSLNTPEYAILSHTWGNDEEEVSFEDMKSYSQLSREKQKYGLEKIEMTCKMAREDYNLKYAWIDTCCIDKTSSVELSESINSMFKWYSQAVVCFAFLADWESESQNFTGCKWFTRGWTLQELVASRTIVFYDEEWQLRGKKLSCSIDMEDCSQPQKNDPHVRADTLQKLTDVPSLIPEIARESRINEAVLAGQTRLGEVPVAVRMSWAAKRTTTREEDIAYSLMGIFDINMSMLYGEGPKAFVRLQGKIIKNHPDMSIFAWKATEETSQDYMGILAPSPREFTYASRMYIPFERIMTYGMVDVSLSSRGVEFRNNLLLSYDRSTGYYILPTFHTDIYPDSVNSGATHGVYLRSVGPCYVRAMPKQFIDFRRPKMGNFTSFRALRTISAKDSKSINRRDLFIRRPHNLQDSNFQIASIYPEPAWTSHRQTLSTLGNPHFVAKLSFRRIWANNFVSFALVCMFVNPLGTLFSPGFWKCDLVEEDYAKWIDSKILHYFNTHDDVLSCEDSAPSLVKKIILLPHRCGILRAKHVELSLERVYDIESGSTRFFVDLEVENHDIRI